MTDEHTRRLADKYIRRDGGAPDYKNASESTTKANAAWAQHAEAVHRVLRAAKTAPTKAERIAAENAFRAIGDAIAQDERRARGRMF